MIDSYDPKVIEEQMIKLWQDNNTYQKAKDKNKGREKFYFLDGPPYTSGRMHIGLAWNKTLKDAFLRYKRMSGIDVWDRAGYDMHGLPTENAAQKKLGLLTKKDIESFGIKRFIEECKNTCVENMQAMNRDFSRLGIWMDLDGAYQSIEKDFMDGVWWLIKQAHNKGRLYEGLRTMTWCANTESALAKHELEYKPVKDKSIFVKFRLKGRDNEYLIIWTTTPWTIPFNLAVMVNPEIDYVKAEVDGHVWYVAAPLAGALISGVADKKYTVRETIKGSELEGLEYEHPFYPILKEHYEPIKRDAPKTHTVILSSEYVDTSAGSGLVHCAPGCGPEDYEVGHRNNIPPFNTIDTKGVFPTSMGEFSGLTAKKDDDRFIEALEKAGAIVASTVVEHDYPHDWRFCEPVIFRTTKQWFFRVEDLKARMIEENNKVGWNPKSAFNAFNSWLSNLRDNSISKQRYWGTPLPIWRNTQDENDYIVIGSAGELESLSGKKVDDLHISSVDDIVINKEGRTYRRVPDILDVWVDAGTASWNCLNYPREEQNFNQLFPAEFILEGKDQIRGWYNLLMIASMIALDRPCYKNVYMHGFVQDSAGRKMSKSLGNIISPYEVIDKHGADVLRFYLTGAANPGMDMNYNPEDAALRQRSFTVLWNVHKYLIDICVTCAVDPKKMPEEKDYGIEERYMRSRLHSTVKKVQELFESYRINEVPEQVERLYLDLSRVYIQFARDKDPNIAAPVIFESLLSIIRIMAPLAPHLAEAVYQNLCEKFNLEEESVHLSGWPAFDEKAIDENLEKNIGICQSAIQSILAARERIQRGVRWPIRKAMIVANDDDVKSALKITLSLIKSQTNIKEIGFSDLPKEVVQTVRPNFDKIKDAFGEESGKVIALLKSDNGKAALETLKSAQKAELNSADKAFTLQRSHVLISQSVPQHLEQAQMPMASIYIDKETDTKLESEGYARELMRRIQSMRKDAGLSKTDSISLSIATSKEDADMLLAWSGQIKEKVGAADIMIFSGDKTSDGLSSEKASSNKEIRVKGKSFIVSFEKR